MPLTSLPRVLAVSFQAPPTGAVAHVQLGFAEDGQRRVRVTGQVSVQLVLQCQRCAQPYVENVAATVAGIVVRDDAAAAQVPHADEPIVAGGDMLDVSTLVADELLLALPMVARCDDPACRSRYATTSASDDQATSSTREDNPFAALSQLKRGDNTD